MDEIPIVPAWATDAQKKQGLVIGETRLYNALVRAGIETAAQLAKHSPRSLIRDVPWIGKKGIAQIEAALTTRGMALAIDNPITCPNCKHVFKPGDE